MIATEDFMGDPLVAAMVLAFIGYMPFVWRIEKCQIRFSNGLHQSCCLDVLAGNSSANSSVSKDA
jgi:hypothetical protein